MPLSKPAAILLDLDDTIIMLGEGTSRAWDVLAARHSSELRGVTHADFSAAIARSRDWLWGDPYRHKHWRLQLGAARAEIVRQALADLGQTHAPDLPERFSAAYDAVMFEQLRLFPGARETLTDWRAAGIPLALVTNGSSAPQRGKIDHFQLAPFFKTILIEGEYGVGKPDERVYRQALADLGAPPERTWMIGDRLEWEVAAPQRLGMAGIWVDVEHAGLPAESDIRPDHIVRNISELRNFARGG